MAAFLDKRSNEQEESHWLSVADLMAGLMMVFLFIAIALMRSAYIERDQIKQVAVAYQENQVAIYQALYSEFKNDIKKWDAEISEDTLTFTFKSPEVLFGVGKTDLTEQYKSVLKDFFPRYMDILNRFNTSIDEVRIEGHTSSRWNHLTDDTDAYFRNMWLSQGRTRSVLNHLYSMEATARYKPWIKKHIAAVGFSSSRVIFDDRGQEDRKASRRVSFRVITNAEIEIKRILDAGE